jgi:hypothetical protein
MPDIRLPSIAALPGLFCGAVADAQRSQSGASVETRPSLETSGGRPAPRAC